jgi:HEAT repeat protein
LLGRRGCRRAVEAVVEQLRAAVEQFRLRAASAGS